MKNNISVKQLVLFFILLILAFLIANFNPFIIQMKRNTSAPILDVTINYSPEHAYKYLNDLGVAGRKAYLEFLLIVDIIFPVAYSILGFLILSFFLQRMLQKNNPINLIKYIPFAVGTLDIVQNFFEIILLLNYPRQMLEFVKIASIITTVKTILANFISIALLIIIIVFIFQKILIKKNEKS